MKKCMEYVVEGSRLRGRLKRALIEVVQRDCNCNASLTCLMHGTRLEDLSKGYHALNTSRSTLIADFYYFSPTNCVTSFMTFSWSFMTFSPSEEFLN